MTLADPLEAFRVGPAGSADDMDRAVGELETLTRTWRKGGAYVAISAGSLFFECEGVLYRVRRGELRGLALTRATSTRMMRWGLLFYIGGLPLLLFLPPLGPVLAIGCAITGAVLVSKGFTGKALLVQVKDERVPPFVVTNRRWRSLRAALRDWERGAQADALT